MKIDLNKPVLDLGKSPIENAFIGKVIASALISGTKGDALKFMEWAFLLHEGKELDLDKSDYETLKSFITNSESITILVKGQALEIINEAK
jgi:hypothetical protein